jgi:hypothetical protein
LPNRFDGEVEGGRKYRIIDFYQNCSLNLSRLTLARRALAITAFSSVSLMTPKDYDLEKSVN